MITLERQVGTQDCGMCGIRYAVLRGSLREDGHPFGFYRVACHGHAAERRVAHLAVSVLDRRVPRAVPVAVALEVESASREFRLTVVEWDQSPLAGETGLGRMLDRAEVIGNAFAPLLLDMAERVLRELPEVEAYFA